MKRGILVILLALMTLGAAAQVKIGGTVLFEGGEEPVAHANIIVQSHDGTKMYSFAPADENGRYSFDFRGSDDSLKLSVTSANAKTKILTIAAKSQTLSIFVEKQVMAIKEVVVRPKSPVGRRGDTLTYIAGQYRTANDVVVEDIIKKLPGVDVAESGKISYQGRGISKLYVEGMDMLGGRYSVATKNIKAEDIASIKVYENHQAIRALEDVSRPDEAAMDIKLTEEAKGTWTFSLLAGVGYKPWSWAGELAAMFFGKNMQSISTYKTNNTGDDVSSEFNSLYGGGIMEAHSILGVQLPTTPPLNENLYLNNNIHAVSTNFLFKFSETDQLKTNVNYAHDYQTSEGVSTTTRFISGAAPIVINESTYAAQQSDRVNVDLKYESNKKTSFLNNTLYLSGDFNKDFGRVLSDGNTVLQDFTLPSLSAKNYLDMIVPLKNSVSLGIKSTIEYNNQPTSLEVTPMLFPEVFNSPAGYPNARQLLNSERLLTRNSVYARFGVKNWSFSVNGGVNAHIEDMTSLLAPMNSSGGTKAAAENMQNDILWQRYDLTVGPGVTYKLGDVFSARAYVYADFMALNSRNRVSGDEHVINKLIANPSLSVNGQITQDLKYSLGASYNEFYGGLYDSYSGFIMTDYRNIASKDGDIRHTKSQNYRASIDYANALDLFFGSLNGSYWVQDNNLTYAIDYDGALSYIHSVAAPNSSNGYNLELKLSKQFLRISTVFNLSGGWDSSWSEIMRQGDMLDTRNDMIRGSFGFNTRFARWLTFNYDAHYIRSMTRTQGIGDSQPIDYVEQEGELSFNFGGGFTASVTGQHYYNGTLSPQYRNMVFLDARIGYKAKRVEYIIEGRNLLGTESFNSAFTSDITNYIYSYRLRPTLLMAKIRLRF